MEGTHLDPFQLPVNSPLCKSWYKPCQARLYCGYAMEGTHLHPFQLPVSLPACQVANLGMIPVRPGFTAVMPWRVRTFIHFSFL